jgi:ABC-type antimicrobial peptide transport system permease subunit
VWLVLRESLVLAAAGILLGIPLSLLATRYMGSLLWKLSPNDPKSFAAGVAGVLLVVLLATFVPAQRAASVEPAEALRNE